jgi:transposase-like protein
VVSQSEMAGPTRLELATSGVTGRRSNQLNYDPARVLTLKLLIADCGLMIGKSKISNQKSAILQTSRGSLARFGRYRTRTCDSRRVKPVLYQLS